MLDDIDLTLLDVLQEDGRASNKELAAKAGLAPSSTVARLRKLRESGAWQSTHARVDPAALGIGLQALLVVRLEGHGRGALDAFREAMEEREEVVQLFHVAGIEDFLVHVAVRDTEHLREFTMTVMAERAEVQRHNTWLIFDHHRAPKWPVYLTP